MLESKSLGIVGSGGVGRGLILVIGNHRVYEEAGVIIIEDEKGNKKETEIVPSMEEVFTIKPLPKLQECVITEPRGVIPPKFYKNKRR